MVWLPSLDVVVIFDVFVQPVNLCLTSVEYYTTKSICLLAFPSKDIHWIAPMLWILNIINDIELAHIVIGNWAPEGQGCFPPNPSLYSAKHYPSILQTNIPIFHPFCCPCIKIQWCLALIPGQRTSWNLWDNYGFDFDFLKTQYCVGHLH